MTERAAAAIASDSRRFHVNDLGWLHLSRSTSFQKVRGRFYRAALDHTLGPDGAA
jgi:hypothetical protein